MKSELLYFLKRVGITLGIVLILDVVFGLFADNSLKYLPDFCPPSVNPQIVKDNYRLHRMESEVVILGSSRATHHYVTEVIGRSIDSLKGRHYSIYNAGIDGKFVNSNAFAAEMIASRYRPQLVIFDVGEIQLHERNVSDIEFTAPFYWQDTILKRYLDKISLKERIVMKSNLYRYNGKPLRMLPCFLTSSEADDGYLPTFGHLHPKDLLDQSKDFADTPLDDYTVENLEHVLHLYQSVNIPLILVYSPSYKANHSCNHLLVLARQYDVPFIDMHNIFDANPSFFRDPLHLNDSGAHFFTTLFVEELKPFLD